MIKKHIITALLVAFSSFLGAQNLIQNGTFEEHLDIKCQSCHLWAANFSATIKPWKNLNCNSTYICDCKYQKDNDEQQRVTCPFDKVKPHSGCTMMQMSYQPNCYDSEHKTRGCASILATTFSKPLEIGKNYEVSFWINILPADDPGYLKHIGILFFPKTIISQYGGMFEGTPFVLDTIIFKEWYQVKWIIKPLCNLECFAIGVFRDKTGPPANNFDDDNLYFIDDVIIKEVSESKVIAPNKSISFCKYEQQDDNGSFMESIDSHTIYFDTGDSTVLSRYYSTLDSLAVLMKKHPNTTFSLNGHTDDIGKSNMELSKARVKSIVAYFNSKHKIPKWRFIQLYSGDLKPIADNNSEIGRSKNRRVEIEQINSDVTDVLYRNLLTEVFNANKNLAFQYLNIWLTMADINTKILMQNDPRLNDLKNDKRWKDVEIKVKKSYQVYKKPALAYSLDSLWIEDQRGRTLEKYIENLQTYFFEIDSTDKRWDVFFPFDTGAIYEQKKELLTQKMTKLIDKNGWFKESEVGKRAAKSAALIMIHSSDTVVMARILPMLESRCKEGEAEWIYYATLSDRYSVTCGRPQKYGTQYKVNPADENHLELFPLENPEMVNRWRSNMGLQPLMLKE